MKKFRIRTKVSFILVLSLLIVETIFFFPSLKNRRTQLVNDKVVTGSNMVGKLTNSFFEINKNIQIVHTSLNEMLLSAKDNVNSSNELSEIINQFHVMTGTISKATQEQSESGKEISSNVEFINNRVQTVAQTAGIIADTISGLTDQANMLKQMISDTAISNEWK